MAGTWAVVDLNIPGDAGVLMIVEDRADAESIAVELRRRGVRVGLVELPIESAPD